MKNTEKKSWLGRSRTGVVILLPLAGGGCLGTDSEWTEGEGATRVAENSVLECGAEAGIPTATWPNGRVPYTFENDASYPSWNSADQQAVVAAMQDWNTKSGGVVQFVPKNSGDVIYISFTNEIGTGCNSPLGMGGGKMTVRLRQCGGLAMRHELGHALGFPHPHNRADRDRYVLVKPEFYCEPPPNPPCPNDSNVYCGYQSYAHYWDALIGDNMNKMPEVKLAPSNMLGPYEYGSIVNYSCSTPATCGITRRDGTPDGGVIPAPTAVTQGDASAIVEKTRTLDGWTPFQAVYRSSYPDDAPLNTSLKTNVNVVGSPALARWDTFGAALVARGTDSHYYVKYNVKAKRGFPGATSWTDIGGNFVSDPAAVSWGPDRLDVVGIGTDGDVWHRHVGGGSTDLGKPSSGTPSAPAIASWGTNRLDIFVVSGGTLYQKSWNGSTWSGWLNVGTGHKGSPGAVSRAPGFIDVVVQNSDGTVTRRSYVGGGWSSESLGGSASGSTGIAISSRGGNDLEVYSKQSHGRLATRTWNGTSWTVWRDLGGLPVGTPAAVSTSTGKVFVAATINDNGANGVWVRHRRRVRGDVNGDGLSDIALAGGSGWSSIATAFSVANGTFGVVNVAEPVPQFSTWSQQVGAKIVSGDFNGDGKSDLALTGPSGWSSIPVAFGVGNGRYYVKNYAVASFAGWAAAAGAKAVPGDFDGDGRTDIALTGVSGWGSIPVAYSNGDGTFEVVNSTTANFPGWAATAGAKLVAADINGDGVTDIVATGASTFNDIKVAFGSGSRNGVFTASQFTVGSFHTTAAAAGAVPLGGDFNGDGKEDIALLGASTFTSIPVILSSATSSTFTYHSVSLSGFPGWAALANAKGVVGDFDGDGFDDVALTGMSGFGTIPVANSLGAGSFSVTNLASPDNGYQNFPAWAATSGAVPLTGYKVL